MKNILYLGNKLSTHGNTPTGIEVLGPLLESEGYSLRYASSKKSKVARLFEMIVATYRFGRKSDLVLIDTYSTLNFWYAFLCSRLCVWFGVKYITILHGGNLPHRLRKSPGLCRKLFGNAFLSVAPSPYLFKIFADEGFKVAYIPNPIDVSDFPYTRRFQLRPKLLWVRSLARIYNPMMALEVLKLVQEKYPDAELCMVGPDKNKILPKLRQFASFHRLNVKFTGRLSKREWALLSEDYDIFLNTSKVDNAPFSLLEATSLGLFILSNNVGGIPHIFTDQKTALLTTPGNAKAMATAVLQLLENKELQGVLQAGRSSLLEQYQWQQIRKKWLQVIDELR